MSRIEHRPPNAPPPPLPGLITDVSGVHNDVSHNDVSHNDVSHNDVAGVHNRTDFAGFLFSPEGEVEEGKGGSSR